MEEEKIIEVLEKMAHQQAQQNVLMEKLIEAVHSVAARMEKKE